MHISEKQKSAENALAPRRRLRLHPDVLKLGLVSLLTDLSSEMIFSVFAVFFTTVAGASSALLGLVEGLADFSASALNYWAGWLSDRSGQRKWLSGAGYIFSTLAKLILLLSTALTALAIFRVVERLGKGFRGPPRDAWLAAIAAQESRGLAFGVHTALDKSGAVLGPLAAYAMLRWLGETAATYKMLFLVACVPAVLSVLVLSRVPEHPGTAHQRESLADNWRQLSPGFKRYLVPSGVFALAYFSLGFLLLKAHAMGFGVADIVLLYALFNSTCVLASPLVGMLGDRLGRGRIVLLGYALYAAVCLWLMLASKRWELLAAFALYGLFYAIDESQSKALIADIEPERRASAVGVYHFITGLMYIPASLLAGALWQLAPAWVFGSAAALAMVAMALFAGLRPTRHSS